MKTRIIKFLPLTAMAFVVMACAPKGESYKVTFDTKNGTWNASDKAYQNEEYKATFVPKEGYTLDERHITVFVSDKKIAGGYSFLDNELKIDKDMVTGDMLVQATPKLISYRVFPQVKYMQITFPEKPYYHKEFVANLETSEEYVLPDTLNVYINDKELTDGFTYSRDQGKLTISADKVEGDITIAGQSTALKPVVFKGHGGSWEEGNQLRVYVPDGATFADAKAKASGLTPPDQKKFRRWVFDETDTTVPDNFVISQSADELVVDARYDEKTAYQVTIDDNRNYFPDDYYRQTLPLTPEVSFEDFAFDLVIDEKDYGTYYLPDNPASAITVKMSPRTAPTVTLECYYKNESIVTHDGRIVKATVGIKKPTDPLIPVPYSTIVGDLSFSFNTLSYNTLTVTFDPGTEGHWLSSGDNKPRPVTLPDDKRYTIFEAALIADGSKSMPVANNSSLVFTGWYTDNPSKTINENSYITSSTTYHAKYESVNFENDSWENVIDAAEQGLPYLYERYKMNEKNIIGCQRSVMIGDSTQGYVNVVARVIGVNHDNVDGGAKTALTFEFQDTFYLSKFSKESYQFYDTAYIRTLLNNSEEGLLGKVPDIISKHVQTVSKPLYHADGKRIELWDKFFLLSANELGLRQGDLPDEKEPVKGDEGSTYAYYENAHETKDILKKGSQIVSDTNYWIRTATKNNQTAYVINSNGICNEVDNYQTEHGVAPAFSIGVAEHPNDTKQGALTFKYCSSSVSKFLIVKNRAGQFNNITVTAAFGKLFSENYQPTATNCTASVIISPDHSSLVCSISYTATQAISPNDITVSFEPDLSGYSAKFNYSNCTGPSGFAITDPDGSTITQLTFRANDGYSFPKAETPDPDDIFQYNKKIYTIKNIDVSNDGKLLTCDISYKFSEGNLNITVIAQEGEVNFVKLNTQHCTSTFVSTPIQGSTGGVAIEITPELGYEFDSSDNYKNSITVGYPSGMSVNYEITENSGVLTIELSYGITSQSGDITISARAYKPGKCMISGNNCKVSATDPIPYYCGQDVSIQVTATVSDPINYTFLDLFDSEIVRVDNQTLRGIVKVTSFEIQDSGKTVVLNISIDRTASCCEELKLTINPREIVIPD